jgi:hypothetical protein
MPKFSMSYQISKKFQQNTSQAPRMAVRTQISCSPSPHQMLQKNVKVKVSVHRPGQGLGLQGAEAPRISIYRQKHYVIIIKCFLETNFPPDRL